jgi:hypothetical protein
MSTDLLAGHFAVFRNTSEIRGAFEHIAGFADLIRLPEYQALDERGLTAVLVPPGPLGHLRSLFAERYTTVLSQRRWHDGTMNYPRNWFFRRGRLTNEQDGEREFLYPHVMRWKAVRSDAKAVGEGAWAELERVVSVDWRRATHEGFCISPAGITAHPHTP